MKAIGEGIAFSGLCAATAWLEINGHQTGGLWALVVIWAVVTDWGDK